MATIEDRLVRARRAARSSGEWFRAMRIIQNEYLNQPAFNMGDWRKVMDRVDAAMKEGPRADWDF